MEATENVGAITKIQGISFMCGSLFAMHESEDFRVFLILIWQPC